MRLELAMQRRNIAVYSDDNEIERLLTAIVRSELTLRHPLEILDAGCGRMWPWNLEGIPYRLTGIDEDAASLQLRLEKQGDLDAWIAGDLRKVALEPGFFDIVHSAYVLEHIAGAEAVLDRLLGALRPGGLLVLRVPDRDSVYSFLTRLAPFWVHIKYKRWIRRRPNAGKPGYGPYPVVYDNIVSLPKFIDWAHKHELEVVTICGDNGHLQFFGKAAPLVDAGLRLIALLSFGRLTARYANLALVFRKPAH